MKNAVPLNESKSDIMTEMNLYGFLYRERYFYFY